MINRKFTTLALGLAIAAVSCKKQDLESKQPPAAPVTSEWKSVSSWTASKENNYTAYSSSISDAAISSDVVDNGMVLVYMKSDNKLQSLPFQQNGKSNTYWYYQVTENTIHLTADVFSATPVNEQGFSYFIIPADKLKTLEEKGYSQSDLMTLTYENAAALLQ